MSETNISSRLAEKARRAMSSSAISSALWVVLGSAGTQVIRLIGNLILTRLLVPELFGIMAIANSIMIGLDMLSDVGLRGAVVNSKRIEEPDFLRTAWTIQVIKGFVMGALTLSLAYPLVLAYGEPDLGWVMVIFAFAASAKGFKSITLLVYDKKMELRGQMIAELAARVLSIIFMVLWAYLSPTIWALAVGALFGALIDLYFSYRYFSGHQSKWRLEKDALREILHFGKWILVSSSISFVTNQGDKLIMSVWMSMAAMGLYSVASSLSMAFVGVTGALSVRVLHPYFRKSMEDHGNFKQVHKVRRKMNAFNTSFCVFVAMAGEWIINVLYDERYQQAGWMLQVLALGQIGSLMIMTLRPFLIARGDSFSQTKHSTMSSIMLVAYLIVGGNLAGVLGVVVGYALWGMMAHPIMIFYAVKHGYNCYRSDMGMMIIAFAFTISFWFVTDATIVDVFLAALEGKADAL
ncbi:MAG: oligosaccharide flippase family protein [Agarilytica sp.]